MPTTVNIHEAKTHLSRLLERVESGEQIIIARAGRPIAQLGPISRPDTVFGALKGQVEYSNAFTEEAEAEVLGMFDDDLGLDVPR